MSFGTVAHDIVVEAERVKADVLKVISDIPAISKDATTLSTVVNGVLAAVNPGAAAVAAAVEAVITKIFTAIDTAGPAVAANGLNVSLDVNEVKAVQAALPTLKAAVK